MVALLARLLALLLCNALLSKGMYRLTENELGELKESCGRGKSSGRFRISNGGRAGQGQFPWALQIVQRQAIDGLAQPYGEKDPGFFERGLGTCTGVLISRWHFMTASHCVEFWKRGVRNVVVGDHYRVCGGSPCSAAIYPTLARIEDCDNRTRNIKPCRNLGVKSFIIPVSNLEWNLRRVADLPYDDITASDIAIFELEKPVDKYDKDLVPICMPDPDSDVPRKVFFVGFGTTGKIKKGSRNVQLFYRTAKYKDRTCQLHSDCAQMIHTQRFNHEGLRICSGDSGGGLISEYNGIQTLHGIISAGNSRCGDRTAPQPEIIKEYSTRVSSMLGFICDFTGICPAQRTFVGSEMAFAVSDGKGSNPVEAVSPPTWAMTTTWDIDLESIPSALKEYLLQLLKTITSAHPRF